MHGTTLRLGVYAALLAGVFGVGCPSSGASSPSVPTATPAPGSSQTTIAYVTEQTAKVQTIAVEIKRTPVP